MPSGQHYLKIHPKRTSAFIIVIAASPIVGLALLPAFAAPPTAAPTAPASDFFETRIRPILAENCLACHGDKLQRGGVRLDSHDAILMPAKNGDVIVPGLPEKSALIRAIGYRDVIKMPPSGKLPDSAIADLTQWVKLGAPWPATKPVAEPAISEARRNFWSFKPVVRPRVPAVKQKNWVRTPIDAFILSGLEAKGLKPAPAADRRTLIRRATYDITGLPPTPAEVEAFVADKSPDAYSKVVDRLLASPRYGERWGRHWLDVVRYADSADSRGLGGEGDISEAWRYRDWVVNALNSDMPYDRFVMNQIAGDLLPAGNELAKASIRTASTGFNVDGTIATTMLAIGNWGNGDADKEKLLTDIADDQVDIVSRAFMGLTVACARCHDHKFDPIPTRDYYGLAGIFSSSHILPKLTPKGQGEIPLRVPLDTPEMKAARDIFAAQLADREKAVKAAEQARYAERARGLLTHTADYLMAAKAFCDQLAAGEHPTVDGLAAAQKLSPAPLARWVDLLGGGSYPLMTQTIRNVGDKQGVFAWRGTADTPNLTVNITGTPVHLLTFTLPPKSVNVHPGQNNGVAVEWVSPMRGKVQIRGKVTDADPACGDGIEWAIDHKSSAGNVEVASGGFTNGGAQDYAAGKNGAALTSIDVAPGDRLEVIVLPKAEYTCDTTTVDFVIGELGGARKWDLTADMIDDPLKSNPRADRYGNPGVWRFSDMADRKRGATTDGALGKLIAAWTSSVGSSTDMAVIGSAASRFQNGFTLTDSSSPFWPANRTELDAAAMQSIASAEAELAALKKTAPPPIAFANAIQEGGCPESPQAGFHDIRVHIRGRYDRLGDMVPRHFPIVIAGVHQEPIAKGSGRLELARWVASPSHPMTARVIVNRIWQYHFGDGIVRTPSNFGFLGERPTNQPLLDWLAAEFVAPVSNTDRNACGWSMKRLHRLIALSAVYIQQSEGAPATVKADPDNRLLGRMNRRRLEAEAIRDSLIAVTGKLDETRGGPAVRDFDSNRRTLYYMTVRSDRSGYAPLFDTADPTASIEKRVVSTVAPQALFLLNNPFAVKRARMLADRAIAEAPGTDPSRIAWLYNLLFGRSPSAEETRMGITYIVHRQSAKPATAATVAAPQPVSTASPKPDVLAWEAYCQALLCTNEFMFVD